MFVKICGITSEDDALLAVALGATAVGFNFAPSSPRRIAPQVAADIAKRLPPEIVTVGVFRDEAPKRVVDIMHGAGLHAVQLHGHETAETARWIGQRVPRVIAAFAAGDARVRTAAGFGAFAILLDAPNPGSGQVFDWSLAAEAPPGQRVIIAGGLDAGNVAAAIEQTKPWGVDVASGVERSPGHKDPVRLREFMAAVQEVAARSEEAWAGPAGLPGPAGEGRPELPGPYDWQEEP